MPTELTVEDVRATIVEAPTLAAGLDKVLASSGCWLPTHLVGAIVDTLAPPTIEHVSRLREPLRAWQDDRYRPTLEKNMRNLTLRAVDRDGHAFAGQPVLTVHALAEMDPEYPSAEDMVSTDTPLTPEQLVALPEHSWIEVRMTVPTRPLA